jgi:hypothetical protein
MVRLLGFKILLVVGAYLAIVGAQAGGPATTTPASEPDVPPFFGKALPSRGSLAPESPAAGHAPSGPSERPPAAPLLREILAL